MQICEVVAIFRFVRWWRRGGIYCRSGILIIFAKTSTLRRSWAFSLANHSNLSFSRRGRMGHSNIWNSHPKTYGPGSRTCRVCGIPHGIIRKYGLMRCGQCFRNNAKEIGFIKYR